MEQKYERQSDRDFSGRHRENEQEHHLTVRLSPPGASRDERQAARIEHDLNAHEGEDEVTPREKSRETQREQDRRQYQGVLHRYLRHVVSPLF
ncbi:MAG: hypothetical protein JWQ42_3319 [Edaphobacter sp.]|nr:hypothetical protein [Edaphobacter sp.]